MNLNFFSQLISFVVSFFILGGVSILCPIQSKTHSRLLALQNVMTNLLSHSCGMNPFVFHSTTYHSTWKTSVRKMRNTLFPIVDISFILQFLSLSSNIQSDLSRSIGRKNDGLVEQPIFVFLCLFFFVLTSSISSSSSY
jgi:hypothetical protein